MLPYAAYLRVYEPVTAFPEPLRSVWTAYAESSRRPRRAHALEVEHGEAVRRMAAVPPVVAPDVESPHAYVRRVGDMLYVSPWETRLRSWLAFERLRDELRPGVGDAFLPQPLADRVADDFERWKLGGRRLRPHIPSSTWHVPLEWFVPFDQAERFLLLGADADDAQGAAPGEPAGAQVNDAHTDAHVSEHVTETQLGDPQPRELPGGERPAETRRPGRGEPEPGGSVPPKATPARTLIYVTAMGEARRRVDEAVRTVRGHLGEGAMSARMELVGEWLAEFHPQALVELDYGGLVHLIDDETLRADQSVAEVSVALAAVRRGEAELAVAMYKRLRARWRAVRALESAN